MALALAAALRARRRHPNPAQASEIRVVVNDTPIKSYDIQRRQAFLTLQQQGGGAERATNEMIDQAPAPAGDASVSTCASPEDEITDCTTNFAVAPTICPPRRLNDIPSPSPASPRDHFRQFIRAQMGLGAGYFTGARAVRTGRAADALPRSRKRVRRMIEQGGE